MQTNSQTTKPIDVQKTIEQLKTLRDEVRVQLHLAGMELREEWNKLEPKVHQAITLSQEARGAAAPVVEDIVAELKRFAESIRTNRPKKA